MTFKALGEKILIPTRVGGTRWVGHVLRAAEVVRKTHKVLLCHLEDVVQQKKGQVCLILFKFLPFQIKNFENWILLSVILVDFTPKFTLSFQKEAQNKARGYIRLLKRPDLQAFLHLLIDILRQLSVLSAFLQSRDICVADVPARLEATIDVLESYKAR